MFEFLYIFSRVEGCNKKKSRVEVEESCESQSVWALIQRYSKNQSEGSRMMPKPTLLISTRRVGEWWRQSARITAARRVRILTVDWERVRILLRMRPKDLPKCKMANRNYNKKRTRRGFDGREQSGITELAAPLCRSSIIWCSRFLS